jgi:hypothetical protein
MTGLFAILRHGWRNTGCESALSCHIGGEGMLRKELRQFMRVRTWDIQSWLLCCPHVPLVTDLGLHDLVAQSSEDAYHAL